MEKVYLLLNHLPRVTHTISPHIQLVRTNNMLHLGVSGAKKYNSRMDSFLLPKFIFVGFFFLRKISPELTSAANPLLFAKEDWP